MAPAPPRVPSRHLLAAPAIALIVVGGINLVAAIARIGLGLLLQGEVAGDDFFLLFNVGINFGLGLVQLIAAICVLAGGFKMYHASSLGWSMAAAVIAMIPIVSTCCLLGVPFGIWSIVVLNNPDVRGEFSQQF